ncbi:MAG: bifunctional lysylphosphatidylglycerol flippase/synthetase MprF [Solirubrobacteraceae bacterium]
MSLSIQALTKRVPVFAAVAAALVGLVNIASTLTPNIRWRWHLLLGFEPVEAIRLFHALSLPAGAALLLVAPYLAKRRRRAMQTAVALMLALGLFDLLKGFDFEETILTWGVAVVLVLSRDAFTVRHDPATLRSAVWRAPVLALMGLAVAMVAVWTGTHASFGTVTTETFDLLRYQPGPIHFHHHIPIGVHMLEIWTLLVIAYVIFRPLTVPRTPPSRVTRQVASDLVRAHGADTLAFFKLRADGHYVFSEDRRAFVGYAIENGVLLLSGDPVGAPDALPGLLQQVREFADARGLKLGALGASEKLCPLYEELGLRAIYLGDEAVVELDRFSLEGRPIRKVRQSVTRLSKAGYEAELHELHTLDQSTIDQAEKVVELGRQGAPERGFSMAMESLQGEHDHETLVVLARDEAGAIRGVLHFVPCYGRPAVSLSFMRRDPTTPNGLTEFLVVRAIELLRERGLEELSLNFAAFAKWMHSPEKRLERLLGKVIALGNPFFQIESLYRFNAKFFPRWEPRFLVYEGTFGLPRAGIAAMWAEGQLPKPRIRRASAAR